MVSDALQINHSNAAAVELYRRTGAHAPNGDELLCVYDGAPASELPSA